MKAFGKEEFTVRFINRSLMYIITGLVIVGGIVLVSLYQSGLLGPIANIFAPSYTAIWRVSDHSNTSGNDKLLQNSQTATDIPKYDDYGVVMKLELNGDGSLKELPRIQGELIYKRP